MESHKNYFAQIHKSSVRYRTIRLFEEESKKENYNDINYSNINNKRNTENNS